MKVLKLEEGSINKESAVIQVLPEDKEDLFALYQIIDEEDELIFKKKFTSKKDEDAKKNTDLVLLKVQVISSEFDINDEFLRYKGKTVADETGRANAEVPVGKFISFTVNYSYPFTIIKQSFDKHSRKLLKEACNPEAKSDGAAVVLQEGIAHVCLLTPSSTILKQKIEYSLPKKKRGTDVMKYDEKTEKFYKAIYAAMKKYYDFNSVKMIILCSPGFYAKTLMDKVLEYAREERNSAILNNKSRFLVAHCSTGYLQGIGEVLKDPAYAANLSDTKYSKEATVMDEFLKHLNDDDYKAWYGDTEVFKAAELGAISNLLITDEKLHTGNIKERKVYLDVMDAVEQHGGSVFTFSTLHETGEELDKLTGIACILKYPLPDLDEDVVDFD